MTDAMNLSAQQRAIVVRATLACLGRAETIFAQMFPPIPVRFDLRGKVAGMYRVRGGERVFRYNPHIFAKYFAEGLLETVPHEVAHYVTDRLYGVHKVRPHGPEWRVIAQALGASPRATARFDLSGIPLRRQAQYDYRCACSRHQLGVRRHHRVQRGEGGYVCRRCRTELVYCAGTNDGGRP